MLTVPGCGENVRTHARYGVLCVVESEKLSFPWDNKLVLGRILLVSSFHQSGQSVGCYSTLLRYLRSKLLFHLNFMYPHAYCTVQYSDQLLPLTISDRVCLTTMNLHCRKEIRLCIMRNDQVSSNPTCSSYR